MVGSRIKHFRELKKLNREWLAQELGIDATQINRIENNQSEVNVSRLLKIAELFNISVIDLFEEKDLNIKNRENYKNYSPVESSYIRYLIQQNELKQKENEVLTHTCNQLLANMQEQQTQFKKLMDYLTNKKNISPVLKYKGGGVKSLSMLMPICSFSF